ncbi:MAG: NfeD family protein [Candidatus Aminicenantes bacterium]|jgi:membrane-bound serine protease (ClpP class)
MPLFLKIIIGVVLAYLLFELFEHVIIPIAWLIFKGKRKQLTGPASLIGEVGEVKEWRGMEGSVFVRGSNWAATSDSSFTPGDKVAVDNVEGLTLIVRPHKK